MRLWAKYPQTHKPNNNCLNIERRATKTLLLLCREAATYWQKGKEANCV